MLEERLRSIPFFRGLPGSDLEALASTLRSEDRSAGDVVFREGDAAEALYLVETGLVEVRRGGEPLAALGPGSFVGELGLLLGEPRSADLVAVADTTLLVLTRASLDELLDQHPAITAEMTRELGRRLLVTNRRAVASPPAQIVGFFGDTAGLDRLVRAVISQTGIEPLVLRADEPVPEFAAGESVVLVVLAEERSRESRTILRKAAFIVSPGPPPEWALRRSSPERVLRCDSVQALERTVRKITRRSIGLALSSGGSKTVAHLGVVDELEKEAVPVDAIAGSSGGSMIAAGMAAGMSHERRVAHLREVATLLGVRRWDFNVPPRTGLMKGRRFRDAVDRMFEGRTFADLQIPLYVVATDLSSGEEVVIDSGPLADGLRASLGIPGAFDPWKLDGRLLIDGAIVNPMPANVLRAQGIDVVIGSLVAGKRDDPSAPAMTAAPPLMQTMLRMVNLMERELIKGQLPLVDLLIRPQVATNYSFDFKSMEEFMAEGTKAAKETIAAADPALLGRSRAVGLP